MRLQSFKRLFRNDFKPEEQDLIEKLSVTINIGFELLYEALNKKLTLSDNFLATEVDMTVELDSSGIPKTASTFSLDFTGRVRRVIVGNAINLTNSSTYPAGAPFISFSQTGNKVVIKHITGLQANNNWKISVIALG